MIKIPDDFIESVLYYYGEDSDWVNQEEFSEPVTKNRVVAATYRLASFDCVILDWGTTNRNQVVSIIQYEEGVHDTNWVLPHMNNHVIYGIASEFPFWYDNYRAQIIKYVKRRP